VPGQTGQPQAQATATRSKAKPGRPKRATASGSISVPEKKVVRNGGAGDPVEQLAPGMSQEQASRQRQSTTELLVATDANLKQISSRRLNPSQQEGVNQIRKYVEQAAQAEKAGDVQRAHNLASKALLLSDDLAKH
jgi:L-aminopeptidase/D-esterase-like protein